MESSYDLLDGKAEAIINCTDCLEQKIYRCQTENELWESIAADGWSEEIGLDGTIRMTCQKCHLGI